MRFPERQALRSWISNQLHCLYFSMSCDISSRSRGVRGVHETGEGLADELEPDDEDIRGDDAGDGAVHPVPARELDENESADHPGGSVDIRHDVLPVGQEHEGLGFFADAHEAQSEKPC